MKTFKKGAPLAALCWSVGVFAAALSGTAAAADTPPYKVAEGNKVDAQTLSGWKTWRAMAWITRTSRRSTRASSMRPSPASASLAPMPNVPVWTAASRP